MEQPKIERVLRLMQLLTGNVNYTINDLADKLDTSYRSIYRYLDTFKDAGFVVQKVGDDHAAYAHQCAAGQVVAAGNDDERDANRQDTNERALPEHVVNIRRRKELV